MGRITWELIRKKAEHHDGLLEDLEELSLHQLNLEKLEVIGRFCPRLKILYLQNNLIPRLENLKRLSSLIYLNVALNNILTVPTEIGRCEKLKKLDLTLNFIDIDELEPSLAALSQLEHLDELYLTGNPCTAVVPAGQSSGGFPHYRSLVLLRLPRLTKLDGTDVTRMERLQAQKLEPEIMEMLKPLVAAKQAERAAKGTAAAATAASSSSSSEGKDDDDLAEEREQNGGEEPSYAEKTASVSAYTPESRRAQHLEAEAFEAKKEADRRAASHKGDSHGGDDMWKQAQQKMNAKLTAADIAALGDALPRQRNMGKWDFTLLDSPAGSPPGTVVLDLALPKFLDTSLIDVDVHPRWLQAHIKGKALLLHFPAGCEVAVDRTKLQRNKANGHLIITAFKVRNVTATSFTTSSANDLSGKLVTNAPEDADGDEEDADADQNESGSAAQATSEAALARSEAAARGRAEMHTDVTDLSTNAAQKKRSDAGAAAVSDVPATGSASSSFSTHNRGGGLNTAFDYRHIARARSAEEAARAAAAQAQMKEVAVSRSATLEGRRQAQAQQVAEENNRRLQQAKQEAHEEMQRLGLDDDGVPDLE